MHAFFASGTSSGGGSGQWAVGNGQWPGARRQGPEIPLVEPIAGGWWAGARGLRDSPCITLIGEEGAVLAGDTAVLATYPRRARHTRPVPSLYGKLPSCCELSLAAHVRRHV